MKEVGENLPYEYFTQSRIAIMIALWKFFNSEFLLFIKKIFYLYSENKNSNIKWKSYKKYLKIKNYK